MGGVSTAAATRLRDSLSALARNAGVTGPGVLCCVVAAGRRVFNDYDFAATASAGQRRQRWHCLWHCSRYGNGTETVLSSSPFASAMSATARPSFNEGVTLSARKPALSRRACSTAARRDPFALAIAALWLCAAV